MVKPDKRDLAEKIFEGTKVQITSEGRRYLGGALRSQTFVETFMANKVADWSAEVQRLAKFAATQPHAAHAAFTHGLLSRWIYTLRVTNPLKENVLQPLEDAIAQKLLPSLTGQTALNANIRALLALPVKLGGMGVVNPTTLPKVQHQRSITLTRPLTLLIDRQEIHTDMATARKDQATIRKVLKRESRVERQANADQVIRSLPAKTQRCAQAAQEKGVSSWLSAVPVKDLGFALHKRAFRDAIALRYGWQLHFGTVTLSLW